VPNSNQAISESCEAVAPEQRLARKHPTHAVTNQDDRRLPIGAEMIGCLMPSRSVRRVRKAGAKSNLARRFTDFGGVLSVTYLNADLGGVDLQVRTFHVPTPIFSR
jgi:hypothetical protein